MTNTSSPRDRVLRVVEAAYELPAPEREPFLERSLMGDARALEEARLLMATDDTWEDVLPGDARSFIDQFKGELDRATKHAELRQQYSDLLGPVLDQLREVGAPIDRFEIGERLGRGGMGEVFRAFDRVLRRDVALKRVRADQSDGLPPSPGIQIRFLQEAQVLAQLEHPGIPTVHEIGIDESGRLFFTMPLVRGESLEERLARVPAEERPWQVPRVVEGLLQAARSIAHSHERGVIHRDLKPDNLMLGRYGAMQVVDWGIARVADAERELEVFYGDLSGDSTDALVASELSDAAKVDSGVQTVAGGALGTPSYMPPEQTGAGGGEIGPYSDVYSLGAILYRLLTGWPAYTDVPGRNGGPPTALELTQRVCAGPPTPARVLAPDAPRELVAICERAMQAKPANRFRSMQSLVEELEAYLAGRVVESYERGAVPTFRKWVARNRALTRSLALAVVLAVLGLTAFLIVQKQADSLTRVRTGDLLLSQLPSASESNLAELRAWEEDANRLLRETQEDDPNESLRVLRDQESSPLVAGSPDFGPSVGQRIEWAELEAQRLGELEFLRAWDEASNGIAASELYGGLRLQRHADLLPLGPDPESGLWEFAHFPSGAPPERIDGQLAIQEGSSLILVLIPGQATTLRPEEPVGESAEEPLAPTSPYFLSKHELTHGQWLRLSGYPTQSFNRTSESDLLPATMLSWDESVLTLGAVGLALPTQAEWEHAARAGTSESWWTGDDWLDLFGSENLCFYLRRFGRDARMDFKDRYPSASPGPSRVRQVLSGRPNPYGLYQVVGNVREWCLDEMPPEDGTPVEPGTTQHVIRGADCAQLPSRSPLSIRLFGASSFRFMRLGVRPSRSVGQ